MPQKNIHEKNPISDELISPDEVKLSIKKLETELLKPVEKRDAQEIVSALISITKFLIALNIGRSKIIRSLEFYKLTNAVKDISHWSWPHQSCPDGIYGELEILFDVVKNLMTYNYPTGSFDGGSGVPIHFGIVDSKLVLNAVKRYYISGFTSQDEAFIEKLHSIGIRCNLNCTHTQ